MTKKGAGRGCVIPSDRHVRFFHGSSRALWVWRGAVDLIDQDHLGKKRTGVEDERCCSRSKMELPTMSAGSRSLVNWMRRTGGRATVRWCGRGCLANAGECLDEQMTAGQDTGVARRMASSLAHDDLADLGDGAFRSCFSWGIHFRGGKGELSKSEVQDVFHRSRPTKRLPGPLQVVLKPVFLKTRTLNRLKGLKAP